MAISFDATSTPNAGTWATGNPISWNHTVGVGATLLITGLFPGSTTDQVTSVTYNGSAMTRVLIWSYNGATINAEYVVLYYLVNPSSGTNSLVWNFTGSQPNAAGGAISYFGTATDASVVNAFQGTANVSTAISPAITVTAANSWLAGIVRQSGGMFSSITGGTNRAGYNGGGSFVFDSNGTVSTGAISPITINNGASGAGVVVIMAIAPPPAASPSRFFEFIE